MGWHPRSPVRRRPPAATLWRDQPEGGQVPMSGRTAPPGPATTPPGSLMTGAVSHTEPGDQAVPDGDLKKDNGGKIEARLSGEAVDPLSAEAAIAVGVRRVPV